MKSTLDDKFCSNTFYILKHSFLKHFYFLRIYNTNIYTFNNILFDFTSIIGEYEFKQKDETRNYIKPR